MSRVEIGNGVMLSKTIERAIREMAEALRFYRDSEWNGGYPGGITYREPGRSGLYIDTGSHAGGALRNRRVRRLLEIVEWERLP